jgi:hypothetical protein
MALTIRRRRCRHFHGDNAEVSGPGVRPPLFGDVTPNEKGEICSSAILWTHAHPERLNAQARHLLAEAWASVAPSSVALPPESLRRGAGPRAGLVSAGNAAWLWWSSSIAHSSAGPVVAAGVVVQAVDVVTNGPRITIGVDVEPFHRFVHPGVARLIAARTATEAPLVTSGMVPLLAVACVKEAIYKADPRQSGRTLADYAWIEARATEDAGWCGIAKVADEPSERFSVMVDRCGHNWLARVIGVW